MNTDNWDTTENVTVNYVSAGFAQLKPAVISARKTYDEGIDVIRSIHEANGRFVILVSSESRTSGPSETQEAECATLEEAKSLLQELCAEDDTFYSDGV